MIKKDLSIKYLVGSHQVNSNSQKPYDSLVIDFLGELSNELIRNRLAKKFTDVLALAFFCRKKNINLIKKKFFKINNPRLGLGLIFHITPSNIPTNFAYSLIFGLLTGNSNIVKVPNKPFEQIKIICHSLNKVLEKKIFYKLKQKILIMRYDRNDEFTKKISSKADARIIWGGDQTINELRKFPIKPRGIDIPFSDRFSISLLNSSKVNKLNKYQINKLIINFFNDTYSVDQNACSSSHIILWYGKEKIKAKYKFWNNLTELVKTKYRPPQISTIDNYTQLHQDFLNLKEIKKYKIYEKCLYVLDLKEINQNLTQLKRKWGFFYQYDLTNFSEIKKIINKRLQTLTYFGFDKNFFKKFIIKEEINGIDRIVPIGEALNIGLTWDGFDLNKILTREIVIK